MYKISSYKEAELAFHLKCKSETFFSYLYDNYSPVLYSIVLKIIPDRELAKDVLQDAFINMWQKSESYDASKGRLFTWMLVITRNLAIDVLRSKGYQDNKKHFSFEDNICLVEDYQSIHFNVDGIGIKQAILKLSPEHKVLMDLVYFKGFTQEGIAAVQGLPLGTVKSRIRAALKELRVALV